MSQRTQKIEFLCESYGQIHSCKFQGADSVTFCASDSPAALRNKNSDVDLGQGSIWEEKLTIKQQIIIQNGEIRP